MDNMVNKAKLKDLYRLRDLSSKIIANLAQTEEYVTEIRADLQECKKIVGGLSTSYEEDVVELNTLLLDLSDFQSSEAYITKVISVFDRVADENPIQ